MQRFFLWLLAALLSFFGVVCLAGCTINLHGTGELGVKQTSSWSMYHRSEQEAEDTESEVEVAAPSLIAWLLGLDGVEEPPNGG